MQLKVVAYSTKIGNFKQITTAQIRSVNANALLLIAQRQEISSKSQQILTNVFMNNCCCLQHKDRKFQANHNTSSHLPSLIQLLLIAQRQEISSKSQLMGVVSAGQASCCLQHKDRKFQANHNMFQIVEHSWLVVAYSTKIGNFKQITTSVG